MRCIIISLFNFFNQENILQSNQNIAQSIQEFKKIQSTCPENNQMKSQTQKM